MENIWARSGIYCQSKWDQFIDIVGDDPLKLWIIGTSIFTIGLYWIYGGLYLLLDFTKKPNFLYKYKIQTGIVVNKKKFQNAVKTILINQIFFGLPLTYFFYLAMRNGPPIHELPTLATILISLVLFIIIEEIGFYYSHRLMHNKYLYKHFHKKHHEWTAPISVIAIYSHPLEHVICNLTPIVLGIIILQSHILTAWIWFAIAIINTINDHSGYSFPISNDSVAFHDFHHAKFNNNFGVTGFLDRLHGTDKQYRKWQTVNNSKKTK